MGLKVPKSETSFCCTIPTHLSVLSSLTPRGAEAEKTHLVQQPESRIPQRPTNLLDIATSIEKVHSVGVEGTKDGAFGNANFEI